MRAKVIFLFIILFSFKLVGQECETKFTLTAGTYYNNRIINFEDNNFFDASYRFNIYNKNLIFETKPILEIALGLQLGDNIPPSLFSLVDIKLVFNVLSQLTGNNSIPDTYTGFDNQPFWNNNEININLYDLTLTKSKILQIQIMTPIIVFYDDLYLDIGFAASYEELQFDFNGSAEILNPWYNEEILYNEFNYKHSAMYTYFLAGVNYRFNKDINLKFLYNSIGSYSAGMEFYFEP